MTDSEDHRIVVDLQRQETEFGWQRWLDRTALAATPRWFEWLGWVAALAALQYLLAKSGSAVIRIVTTVSTLLLWYYFNAFFFAFELRGVPGVRSERAQRAVSLVLSGTVAWCAWRFAVRVAAIVAANTP